MVSGAAFEQDEFITSYSPFPGMTEEREGRMKRGRDLGRERKRMHGYSAGDERGEKKREEEVLMQY